MEFDPATVAVVGLYKSCFVMPVCIYEKDGDEIIVVQLTAWGNEALREVCHTADQRDVWRFPSYEFAVCKDSLSITQVSVGSSQTGIRLTKSADLNSLSFICQYSAYCFLWYFTMFLLLKQHLHCFCGRCVTPRLLGWFLRRMQVEGSWSLVFVCKL